MAAAYDSIQIRRLSLAMNTARLLGLLLADMDLGRDLFAVMASSTEQSQTSAQRQRAAREPAPKPFTRASSTAGVLARLPAEHRLTSVLIAAYTCTLLGFVLQPVCCSHRFPDQQSQAGVPLLLQDKWCTTGSRKCRCLGFSLLDGSQGQKKSSPPEGHPRPGVQPWKAQCPSRARPCGALLLGTAAS
jgi:hypothetical protein